MKLNSAVQDNEKAQKERAKMSIDKEATERIIKNALGSQIKEDEAKNRQKLKSKRNMMSSSDDENSEQEENEGDLKGKNRKSVPKVAKKLPQSKPISKQKGSGASRKDMHGATVVPIAAHLKYKKLLEKK